MIQFVSVLKPYQSQELFSIVRFLFANQDGRVLFDYNQSNYFCLFSKLIVFMSLMRAPLMVLQDHHDG